MSAAYTPPARGHDGLELCVQPERFARTGAGLLTDQLRDEFYFDAQQYSIDAPPQVPRGSVQGYLVVPTIDALKAWHYLDSSDSREFP